MRVKLLALKTEILNEGDVTIEPARKDSTDLVGDEDADPLTEMNQVIASKRNRSRTDVLAKVLAALKRMDETPDDFGLCADCGDPIGRRLEAMPYVDLCLECQSTADQEAKPRSGRRRHAGDYR